MLYVLVGICLITVENVFANLGAMFGPTVREPSIFEEIREDVRSAEIFAIKQAEIAAAYRQRTDKEKADNQARENALALQKQAEQAERLVVDSIVKQNTKDDLKQQYAELYNKALALEGFYQYELHFLDLLSQKLPAKVISSAFNRSPYTISVQNLDAIATFSYKRFRVADNLMTPEQFSGLEKRHMAEEIIYLKEGLLEYSKFLLPGTSTSTFYARALEKIKLYLIKEKVLQTDSSTLSVERKEQRYHAIEAQARQSGIFAVIQAEADKEILEAISSLSSENASRCFSLFN